jgi:hypothetical protein
MTMFYPAIGKSQNFYADPSNAPEADRTRRSSRQVYVTAVSERSEIINYH